MDYAIKHIRASGIEAALQKADKYRELAQPAEAESICRDVLAVDPDNQLAFRILGLALTDRFESFSGALFGEAQAVFARLHDPYERAFYAGLVCERQAKAQLVAHLPVASIRALFDQALTHYAEAESIRPPGNDDPILRWNSCVRALDTVQDAGRPEAPVTPDWDTDFVPHRR
jgi:tetratricopeptide (TPR) repeat protein